MKFHVPNLKLGEAVRVQVVDTLPGNELVITLDGDLIRVANESDREIYPGEMIELIVTALKPLQFRVAIHAVGKAASQRRAKIDVSI